MEFIITHDDRGNSIKVKTEDLDTMLSISRMLDRQNKDHSVEMLNDEKLIKRIDYKY